MDAKEYNELLNKIDIGDKTSLKRIYDVHIVVLYDYLYNLFADKDKTNDILAAFFIDIWNNTNNYINFNDDVSNFLINKLNAFMEENYD